MELVNILEVIQLCYLLPALQGHIVLAALASAYNAHATMKIISFVIHSDVWVLQESINEGVLTVAR